MGVLYTRPEQRRRGRAGLCLRALALRLLGLGLRPHAYVEEDNAASKAFFAGLGFRRPERTVHWIAYEPKGSASKPRLRCV